jgi:imidazolonepropionase-like amidohydrolase
VTDHIVFRHVRVFDGERIVPADSVTVAHGVITGVGYGLAASPGASVVDGGGTRTLLPGLIDSHTHVVGAALARALAFGVTTELDMANHPPVVQKLKALDKEPEAAVQADLRSAGAAATVPGGHGTQFFPGIPTLTTPGQAAEFVSERVTEGSDYIKIHYKDGRRAAALAGRELPVLSPETMAAVAAAARHHGLLSLAHIGTQSAAFEAITAGVTGLAHIFVDGPPDPGFAALAAERGTFIIPTLTMAEGLGGGGRLPELAADPHLSPRLDATDLSMLRRLASGAEPPVPVDLRAAQEAVSAAFSAGVPVLAGTDSIMALHGAALHYELALLAEAGLSPAQALSAATSVPAHVFGLTDRGRIAPGLRADLLLVDGDPTGDIHATRAMAGIWKRGVEAPGPEVS